MYILVYRLLETNKHIKKNLPFSYKRNTISFVIRLTFHLQEGMLSVLFELYNAAF